ncbi:MAG: response regulator containing a CheY-like receiver domain and an DNA-binding domain [Flavipsychrobacter sp.]|jgi:CheY-like chemotaxis protein|nr:response regulator containing a CheY-like receiver domain and an DNA-binding domain [Flavipsychrobacter sp.]
MSFFQEFIIIDDDAINNKICRKIIEKTYPDIEISDFIDPQEGFNYVVTNYAQKGGNKKAILLLDITMPVMDAWDFLELFDKLDANTKSRVKIHILSSSVNKDDMSRAQSNKNVEYYLIKPLTKESIRLIVHVLERRLGINAM